MRHRILTCVAVAGVLLAYACSAGIEVSAGPARPGPTQFDHAGHLSRGVDCGDCHGGEAEAWKAQPAYETCEQCHAELDPTVPPEKHAKALYDEQGKNKFARAGAQSPEVIFDHAAHVGKLGGDCASCHATTAKSAFIAKDSKLTMAACMSCHAEKAPEKNDCAACHREIRIDRAPPSHRSGWKVAHGRVAATGAYDPLPQDCAACHKPADCDTCHRAEAPRDHGQHFRLRGHAAAASIDRDRCDVCHTTDSCAACHQTVKPRNHVGAFGAPHDRHCNSCHLPLEGFADQGCAVCHRGSPGHDSSPARPLNVPHQTSNPEDCRACHQPMPHPDNGQSCLLCHR